MSTMELPDPGLLLANGFASRVTGWARDESEKRRQAGEDSHPQQREAAQRLYRAAWHASKATTDGHVCALLADIAADEDQPDIGAWRRLLLQSGVVGTPEHPGACPLILDSADRLYLHKYMAFEKSLANRLLQADWTPAPPSAATCDLLDRLFARQQQGAAAQADHEAGHEADWQKIAAALALLRPVTIISGGPGTGKTTTVANILACLLADNPACRIALAAPTGKAAARMLEALRARAGAIPDELVAGFPQESFTVHRLLGVTPSPGVFRHDATRPLPIDVLVVDEASMLDLALAARLFDAVPRSARIILLGDKDQLSAVEAGAVFSELSANPALDDDVIARVAAVARTTPALVKPLAQATQARGTGVTNAAVWLRRNYRFGRHSPIGQLASLIVAGEAARTIEWLRQQQGPLPASQPQPALPAPRQASLQFDWISDNADNAGQDGNIGQAAAGKQPSPSPQVQWIADEGDQLPAAALELAVQAFLPYAGAVQTSEHDPLAVFAAFDQFRVLCAVRNGTRGVAGVNQLLSARMAEYLPAAAATTPWHVGRPVIVLRNDYTLRLFNGDIGIALRDSDGQLMVMFPDREKGFRPVGIARLPEHDTAWAMTVHRSQGSEFTNVMAVLPGRDNRVVTRELLYTAVTRTKEGLVLVAPAKSVSDAVTTRTVRASGLADRLAGR